MKNKNYEWVENRTSVILKLISIALALLSMASLSLFSILNPIMVFYIFGSVFGISIILLIISAFKSTKDEYTQKFIKDVCEKIDNITTITELDDLYEYVRNQAVDGNEIRLSNPLAIKGLLNRIKSKITEACTLVDFCKFYKTELGMESNKDSIILIDNFYNSKK
jgi:hypothetical protein